MQLGFNWHVWEELHRMNRLSKKNGMFTYLPSLHCFSFLLAFLFTPSHFQRQTRWMKNCPGFSELIVLEICYCQHLTNSSLPLHLKRIHDQLTPLCHSNTSLDWTIFSFLLFQFVFHLFQFVHMLLKSSSIINWASSPFP